MEKVKNFEFSTGNLEQKEIEKINYKTFLYEQWMADTKEKTLKPTSLDTLLDTIRLYVVPEFGMYQLNQIDSKMLQAHINYLAGRYSLRTVKKAYDALNSSLSYALQLGYIENNPMQKVIKPTESGVAVKKRK